ncbi:DUF3108 domain-containing protein [Azohydromonas lata]|uniref:DUF3108 domain-containing protein n=1 Tax=Azohydromonas lata TaxID=45677 RepID=A0ABU5IDA5_9BURK|nr:DUF3108 domain-containing protein [Azohydromonas lata]MDZ5456500.1 DUF3108 domain-containing protein [Azohydromonas lata]
MPSNFRPRLRPRRRLLALTLLALAVLLAHVRLLDEVALSLPQADAPPPPIEVAFVRELAPTVPPPPPAAPPKPPPPPPVAKAPPKPAEAASAPKPREEPPREEPPQELPKEAAQEPSAQDAAAAEAAASAPQAAASAPAETASTVAKAASDPAPAASAPAAVAAASAPLPPDPAASAVPVAPVDPAATAVADPLRDWPPSTQLEYELGGWYRGEVHGSARVLWLRQDRRYQVRLEVVVGPGFAPLMTRRMTSDGEVNSRGLSPRRYDEETQLGFLSPRRATVRFEDDAIVLANGSRRVPMAGVQDSASQFVQLTWLFTLQPSLLRRGNAVELPLALPRRLDPWTYDVLGEEEIETPLGRLSAVHVKPRREPVAGEVMTAEAWFAPSLQYLPVRLLIRQSADVWADLRLKRLPLQSR